jgi:hypothetical protein
MDTTPHGRLVRLRKPALAAMAAATVAVPAAAEAQLSPVAPADPPLHATISHHALIGSKLKVRGRLGARAGEPVLVQQARHGRWRTVARTRTGAGGRFAAPFRATRLGRERIRVSGARATDRLDVTVYRAVRASWYGPGLYGNRLACGGRLSPGRIGVANKTLPCGTRVHLRYRGRNVTAPVIDRGPYVGGRTFDLTAATKRRLGFASTGTVWSSR